MFSFAQTPKREKDRISPLDIRIAQKSGYLVQLSIDFITHDGNTISKLFTSVSITEIT